LQNQHDVYGSVVLATTQMFVDERLPRMGDEALFRSLEPLGERAAKLALTPDAGIWEYRGRSHVHTYSAALCWAACHRLWQIAARLGIDDRAAFWRGQARALREPILAGAWNPSRGALTGVLGGNDLDASVVPRLIVVSNRVAVPGTEAPQAGGLAVAVNAALKQREGIWFGWSGRVAEDGAALQPTVVSRQRRTFITLDLSNVDFQEYYNGFANRVLRPVLP